MVEIEITGVAGIGESFPVIARLRVEGQTFSILEGDPTWAIVTERSLFDLETGETLSFPEDGERWALNLPQSFRSGYEAARITRNEQVRPAGQPQAPARDKELVLGYQQHRPTGR